MLEPDPINLSATSFWAQPMPAREAAFAELRRERPISWHDAPEAVLIDPEESTGGYWAVVGHDDVRTVSRDPETFCSGLGVLFEDSPPEMLEASMSFIAMDAPRHTKLRQLVSSAFTPRQVRKISDQITSDARRIVDDVAGRGACDFVEDIAKRLPMMTIWRMMGASPADFDRLTATADVLVGWNDPEVMGGREPIEALFEAVLALTADALELAESRMSHGADDLMTALVCAEVDGDRLTEAEISAFFVLLAVAGNDTTRHTTSHAMKALCDFPEQRKVLCEDLGGRIETAVEEFVRWATPVMVFRRTATRDTEIRGVPIAAGDKVVLFYTSANRDEQAFADPGRFDVLRSPNHHVGFGGGGPHYCMGAALARLQLKALFTELLTLLPNLRVGGPEPLIGNFINGIKRMPCEFTPREALVQEIGTTSAPSNAQ
jgi:cytochrome P450